MGMGWRVYSTATAPTGCGMMHYWGRVNPTKDSAMYPKPEYDLQGWDVQRIACGNSHCVVEADKSAITWGTGCSYGELGYGAEGPKSSAKPKKVDSLEGAVVGAVACGTGHTMWLLESGGDLGAVVRALPAFTPLQDAAPAAKGAAAKGAAKGAVAKGGKREAAEPADKGKKKAKK